jgi:hypothetical protein
MAAARRGAGTRAAKAETEAFSMNCRRDESDKNASFRKAAGEHLLRCLGSLGQKFDLWRLMI